MSRLRILLDENLAKALQHAITSRAPELDVLRVGDPGAPPTGTLDPDILRWLEQEQRLLVTNNRVSIPGHIADHAAEGGQHWGIVWVRLDVGYGRLAEEILLLWEVYEAEEWIDRTEWIP
ncbi:MAG TPA: DUF5615 family PIN-like protein [Herpetosiphonaceae bacterium]